MVLARALLKRQKVLILDEATASIDSATDAEISQVIHNKFAGVTVLICQGANRPVEVVQAVNEIRRGSRK